MCYNPFSLAGKTIFITGASSGIGQTTAIECSKMGAKLIITARNEEKLKQTFDALEGNGHQILLCDLSDPKQITSAIDTIPEVQGVVNNAGINTISAIQSINENTLKHLLDVNTIAPMLILKNLLKKKKIRKGASVVFTNSVSGLGNTSIGNSMYASTKGAITAFVKGAALELSTKGIRVNAVCPGMVETNMLNNDAISNEQLENGRKNYPLQRYGNPKEIAWAMIYLLSDASTWTTGTNLVVDGGYVIR